MKLELNVVRFENEDIIATSVCDHSEPHYFFVEVDVDEFSKGTVGYSTTLDCFVQNDEDEISAIPSGCLEVDFVETVSMNPYKFKVDNVYTFDGENYHKCENEHIFGGL